MRTSSVELESRLQCNLVFSSSGLSVGSFCIVETVNISLVVLLMMQGHYFLRNVGF